MGGVLLGALLYKLGKLRCYHIIAEANSNLKLLPVSILDIYTVFEHIDMLSIDIW